MNSSPEIREETVHATYRRFWFSGKTPALALFGAGHEFLEVYRSAKKIVAEYRKKGEDCDGEPAPCDGTVIYIH